MLCLSRKRDEFIAFFGGLITVHVIDIRGDKVRLGVTAPPEVDVHRQEVLEAIKAQRPITIQDIQASLAGLLAAAIQLGMPLEPLDATGAAVAGDDNPDLSSSAAVCDSPDEIVPAGTEVAGRLNRSRAVRRVGA